MKTLELKNRDAVVDAIAETMRNLDKESANYETEVYLYIDDNGNGTVDTFVNPGGNSWLDDDHIVVYSDSPHCDDFFDSEDGRSWDELDDDEKDDFLPDMKEYIYRAAYLLTFALDEEDDWKYDPWW